MRRKITSAGHGWLQFVRTDLSTQFKRGSRRKSFIYIEMDLERYKQPTENLHTPANELNLISEKRDKYFHPTYHCEHKSNPISCSDFFPSVFLRHGSYYLHTQDEVCALTCVSLHSETAGQMDRRPTLSSLWPPTTGLLLLGRTPQAK